LIDLCDNDAKYLVKERVERASGNPDANGRQECEFTNPVGRPLGRT